MSDFSKTGELCDCDTLQNAADNPDLPIIFDTEANEFHFVYNVNGGEGRMYLYHCFFCGGKAPESRRHLLFAMISEAERFRLRELTSSLKTLDEIWATLGKPDQDYEDGAMFMLPETENQPSKEQSYRSLVYRNFSDVADIRVTVYPNDRVGIGFTGKYIGKKDEA